jgi:hypothetical protein
MMGTLMMGSRWKNNPSDYVAGGLDVLFVTVMRCKDMWELSAGRENVGKPLLEKAV